MTAPECPRCGDHVIHVPSGERWVVAFADPAKDEIAWAGWPDGRAKLSDCTVVKKVSDGEHNEAVNDWRELDIPDSRMSRVIQIYGGGQ